MSPIVTLRPNGSPGVGDTTVVPSSATRWGVLADDSDASYHVGVNVATVQPAVGQLLWQDIEGVGGIPDGARVEWVEFRGRLALVGAYDQRIGLWVYSADDNGLEWSEEMVVTRDGVIRGWSGRQEARRPRTGRDWRIADVDGVYTVMQFYDLLDNPSGDVYLYEAYLDVSYRRPGTTDDVAIDSNAITRPTVTWTANAPDTSVPAVAYQVRVFDLATTLTPGFGARSTAFKPIYDSGVIKSRRTSGFQRIDARLVDGESYVAYVWTAQQWDGTAGWFWPLHAGSVTFTIDLPAFATPPQPSVRAFDAAAAVEITIQGGYVPGTSDPVSYDLQRSADGGESWEEVRGFPADIAGGAALTAMDYEAERGVGLLYRLRGITDNNNSDWTDPAPTFLSCADFRLKDVLNPQLNRIIKVVSPFGLTRPEPQARHDPLGADKAIVVSDGVKAYTGKLVVQTEGTDPGHESEEYDAIMALIGASRTLLLQDAIGRQWYIRVGDKQEIEWLRSTPPRDSALPVRFLHRITFEWNEVQVP